MLTIFSQHISQCLDLVRDYITLAFINLSFKLDESVLVMAEIQQAQIVEALELEPGLFG